MDRAARLARQDRLILLSAVSVLVALSWLLLAHAHVGSVLAPEPSSVPWSPERFALALGMWLVMMVAMMLPPVLPWILFCAELGRRRQAESPYLPTLVFVCGYLTLWILYALAAAVVQGVLEGRGLLPPGGSGLPTAVAGAVLVAAGAFQLTPLKSVCLSHCRSPLGFFLTRWRDRAPGAFGMGLRHGLYCLGCCWALMALMFVVGVMNLLWMAALTVVLCLEKLAPRGESLARLFGALFALWGLWLLAAGGS